jgi:hypothetical protein
VEGGGGGLVEEAEESGFSGLSFSRSLSLSFLKMWASWTMSGLPSFFFFSFWRGSKDDEGGRNAEIGMGLNHGSDLEFWGKFVSKGV